MGNKFAAKVKFCLLPAAVGLLLFYLIPYGKVILYSVVKSQYQKRFVGLRNYREVLENPYFQLACWNTLLMILICVPLFVILSIVISVFCMQRGRTGKLLHRMSILPLLLPSAGAVAAFSILFGKIDNPFPVYGMFLWKYVGMGVVILTAAFSTVDPQIKEAARMDGAGMYVICRKSYCRFAGNHCFLRLCWELCIVFGRSAKAFCITMQTIRLITAIPCNTI